MPKKYQVPIVLLCKEDMVGLRKSLDSGEPLCTHVSHVWETDDKRGEKSVMIVFRPRQEILEFTRRQAINDIRGRKAA